MTDIHCHILPGADDGSGGMGDSIEMAQMALDSRVRGIVATPHANLPGMWDNCWSSEMEGRLAQLQGRLRQLGIDVAIYPGQEIFLGSGYLEALQKGKLIGLNHSRYLLVEFDMQEPAGAAYGKLGQVAAEGYVPIVAHPERYGFVQEDGDAARRLKDMGCLLQLNKGSFKGSFGRRAMTAAHRIMGRRMTDIVASDAHSQYRRTTYLAEIHELISVQYSYEYANLLLEGNPEKVVRNMTVDGW